MCLFRGRHVPPRPRVGLNSRVGKTVMIVEDDEEIRLVLRYALEDEGYRVLEAANGEQALVLGQDEDPDVLLVDLRLPGIHGLDVVRSVRATSRGADHHRHRPGRQP